MSDDLDFDMEVVEDDELDELGSDNGSTSEERFSSGKNESVEETVGSTSTETVETNDAGFTDTRSDSKDSGTGSGVFGLGSVPDEWGLQSLPDVVEIEMGSSPPSSTYNEEREGLPFYQGNADFGHMAPKVSTWCSDPVKTADKDDVLISIRAPVGDLNIADEHCCIGRGLAALRPDEVNGLYLFYGLAQRSRWLSRLASGSTFKSVSSADLEKVDLPIPPLPEQRKIASVLSAVDQAIQKTEAIIEQAQRVKRGLMQDLLSCGIDSEDNLRSLKSAKFGENRLGKFPSSWKLEQLRTLTTESITYGIVQPGEDTPGGVPFIRSGDATADRLEPDSLQRTTEEIAESYSRSRVNAGEVITTIRATVGESHQVPDSLDGANLGRGVARIVPKEEIDNRFLLWAMRSGYMERQFKMHMKGSTYSEITLEQLGKLKVALPEPREQEQISEVLDTQEGKIRNEQDRAEQLRQLKKALMQDLLTGEVRTADKAIDVLDEIEAHG